MCPMTQPEGPLFESPTRGLDEKLSQEQAKSRAKWIRLALLLASAQDGVSELVNAMHDFPEC